MSCKTCSPTFRTLSTSHPADLEDRLRSNHRSSSSETSQITNFLSEAEADILRCDAEVIRLRSLIISIQNNRKELQFRRDGYSSLLAPIRRLPTEILTDIFVFCRGSNDLSQRYLILPNLGKVCSHWRNVVIASSKLWSTFSITDEAPPLEILDVYLARSGQSPLTISLSEVEPEAMERSVMKHILRHSTRWLDVPLQLTGTFIYSETFGALRGKPFPLLQRLHLDSFSGGLSFGNQRLDHQVFESLPRLHTLSLGTSICGMTFPWIQIVHLVRQFCGAREFIRYMGFCPNIETAHLSDSGMGYGGGDEGEEENRSVTSERLHTFSIESLEPETMPAVFGAVTLPSLKSLSIEFDDDAEWPQDIFISFLERSSCNITTFSLSNVSILDIDLISVLRRLPSLNNLSVKGDESAVTDKFLDTMNAYSSRSSLLPDLQVIDLAIPRPQFSDQCFVDMVHSRWSPTGTDYGVRRVTSLRSVSLVVAGGLFDPAKRDTLSILMSSGMRISIVDQKTVNE